MAATPQGERENRPRSCVCVPHMRWLPLRASRRSGEGPVGVDRGRCRIRSFGNQDGKSATQAVHGRTRSCGERRKITVASDCMGLISVFCRDPRPPLLRPRPEGAHPAVHGLWSTQELGSFDRLVHKSWGCSADLARPPPAPDCIGLFFGFPRTPPVVGCHRLCMGLFHGFADSVPGARLHGVIFRISANPLSPLLPTSVALCMGLFLGFSTRYPSESITPNKTGGPRQDPPPAATLAPCSPVSSQIGERLARCRAPTKRVASSLLAPMGTPRQSCNAWFPRPERVPPLGSAQPCSKAGDAFRDFDRRQGWAKARGVM